MGLYNALPNWATLLWIALPFPQVAAKVALACEHIGVVLVWGRSSGLYVEQRDRP